MKNKIEFGPHELLLCRLELEFCICSSSCAHCRLAIEKKTVKVSNLNVVLKPGKNFFIHLNESFEPFK